MKRPAIWLTLWLTLAGMSTSLVQAELDAEDYLGTPPPRLTPEERKEMEAAIEAAREEARRREQERALAEEAARRAREAQWAALPPVARLTRERCTDCHEASTYGDRTFTRLSAEMTVLRMQWLHDAHLEPGERSTIARYLAAEYGAPMMRRLIDTLAGMGLVALVGFGIWRLRKRHFGQPGGERN
jgi:hypothetical protein